MQYRPVKGISQSVSLREAILKGISPDGALYIPESLPKIPRAFFNNISGMTLPEIGYVVANMFFGADIPPRQLKELAERALDFEIPFYETEPNKFTLDLTKGPTRNYNDLGARFMAAITETLFPARQLNVLVATSSNVGNAVADAFSRIAGATTYVVSPSGSLSPQRHDELFAYGDRVVPVEVAGTFPECQAMVRDAILDPELQREVPLLSANSVNVAILLPRVIVFFYAYARLAALNRPLDNVVIATPTENLGNLTAAVIARKMGLPVGRFIAILQNDLDAADIINESRLVALLGDENGSIEITEPDTHPLRPEEICITMITDTPGTQTAHRHRHQVRIGVSESALRKVILSRTSSIQTP